MNTCSRCGGAILTAGPSHYAGPVCACGALAVTDPIYTWVEMQYAVEQNHRRLQDNLAAVEAGRDRLRRERDELRLTIPDINWRPISEMPEELKDGDKFLLGWRGEGKWNRISHCQWIDNGQDLTGWYEIQGGAHIQNPTHFCPINAPEVK